MLTIVTSHDVPDDTYFRTGAAEPDLDGESLTIYTGTGTRRSSWGQPGVTSTVVVKQDDLVAIHVGYHHKHGGGQFWRYYAPVKDSWQTVTWATLSDELRQRVLDAMGKVPSWAKEPGKLRATYQQPTMKTQIAFKLVKIDGKRMLSVFDGSTEYVLGKRLAEKAQPDHNGGFYAYSSITNVKALFATGKLFPKNCYQQAMMLALLEVEISGTILDYHGKLAATYLKPLRVVETINYQPQVAEVG